MNVLSVCHQNPPSLIYKILSFSNSRTAPLYFNTGWGGHNLIRGYSLTHSDSSINSKNGELVMLFACYICAMVLHLKDVSTDQMAHCENTGQ